MGVDGEASGHRARPAELTTPVAELQGIARVVLGTIGFAIAGNLIRVKLSEWTKQLEAQHDGSIGSVYPDFMANMLGCFIMGWAAHQKNKFDAWHHGTSSFLHWAWNPSIYVATTSWLCGSITTFSSWNAEVTRTEKAGPRGVFVAIVGLATSYAALLVGLDVSSMFSRILPPPPEPKAPVPFPDEPLEQRQEDMDMVEEARGENIDGMQMRMVMTDDTEVYAKHNRPQNIDGVQMRPVLTVDTDDATGGSGCVAAMGAHSGGDNGVGVGGGGDGGIDGGGVDGEGDTYVSEGNLYAGGIKGHWTRDGYSPVARHTATQPPVTHLPQYAVGPDTHAHTHHVQQPPVEPLRVSERAISLTKGTKISSMPLHRYLQLELVIWSALAAALLAVSVQGLRSDRYSVMWLSCFFAPIGASVRYGLGRLTSHIPWAKRACARFPLHTFTANVLGCLLTTIFIGHAGMAKEHHDKRAATLYQALKTGLCGCLSTMSSFALEIHLLDTRAGWFYVLVTFGASQAVTHIAMAFFPQTYFA